MLIHATPFELIFVYNVKKGQISFFLECGYPACPILFIEKSVFSLAPVPRNNVDISSL